MDSTIFLWIVPFFLVEKSKAFLYRKSTFQLALHYKSFFVFSLTVLLLLSSASHFSCKTLPLVHAFGSSTATFLDHVFYWIIISQIKSGCLQQFLLKEFCLKKWYYPQENPQKRFFEFIFKISSQMCSELFFRQN